jgi:hypothetical protein
MYPWLTALHILMVVIWLGTDIGTFASFHRVLDTKLSVPTRLSMSRMSNLLDQGPRSALVILLMLGITMTRQGGWGLSANIDAFVSLVSAVIGFVWLVGIWYQYWVNHPPTGMQRSADHLKAVAIFRTVDLVWRILLGIIVLITAVVSLLATHSDGIGSGPIAYDWLSWKLVLFAGIVADGVLIRMLLPKLGGAIVSIATQGSSPEREAILAKHGRTAKTYVLTIWLAFGVMSGLAVMKPSLDVTFYGFVKTLHILSIATWFGVDLGVFVAAKLCLDSKLSVEARGQFAKLFGQLDLGPRISMLATVPLVLTMLQLRYGFLEGKQWAPLVHIIIGSVVLTWIPIVIRQHRIHDKYSSGFAKIDTVLRVLLMIGMTALGLSLIGERKGLGLKSIFFAIMVACGLWIRYGLRDFGVAFVETQSSDAVPTAFVRAQKIMRSVYAPVFIIWALLIVNIVLATVKPT